MVVLFLLAIVALSTHALPMRSYFNASYTDPSMKLVLLPLTQAHATGAVCLDGSAPGFYIQTNPKSSLWVLFFQGGGWCYSPEVRFTDAHVSDPNVLAHQDCLERAKTGLGSSHSYPAIMAEDEATGLFDSNATINPFFNDANKVYFMYCDGASFSGDASAPMIVNGTQLFFRGHRVVTQLVQYLLQEFGLASAQQVLLSGCSAGGLATYLHADYVRSLLPRSVKRFKAAPVSGFFLDHSNVDGTPVYPSQMKNVFLMQNCTNGVNAQCVAANAKTPHKCMFAEHTYPHIQTPIFVANSMYDSWSLAEIFTVNQPDAAQWHHCIAAVANCTVAQVAVLNAQWQNDFLQRLLMQPKFWSRGNGGFLHSIITHCGEAIEGAVWNARVSIGGVRMNEALGMWFNDLRATSHYIGCTLNEVAPFQCADP